MIFATTSKKHESVDRVFHLHVSDPMTAFFAVLIGTAVIKIIQMEEHSIRHQQSAKEAAGQTIIRITFRGKTTYILQKRGFVTPFRLDRTDDARKQSGRRIW